jgi:hypothetical protein
VQEVMQGAIKRLAEGMRPLRPSLRPPSTKVAPWHTAPALCGSEGWAAERPPKRGRHAAPSLSLSVMLHFIPRSATLAHPP